MPSSYMKGTATAHTIAEAKFISNFRPIKERQTSADVQIPSQDCSSSRWRRSSFCLFSCLRCSSVSTCSEDKWIDLLEESNETKKKSSASRTELIAKKPPYLGTQV